MTLKPRFLLCFGLFLLSAQTIQSKPLENVAAESKTVENSVFKDPINVVDASPDNEKQIRKGRQNIRVLDPDDFDVAIGGKNRDVEVFDPPKPAVPPRSGSPSFISILFPKKNSPGLISRLLGSSSAGSSSSQKIISPETLKRIRRQTEQILVSLQNSVAKNATNNKTNETKPELSETEILKQDLAKPELGKQLARQEEEGGENELDEGKGDQESAADSSEEDEPPGGGDGMGGGILGILTGLFAEGGQSDLGTLLTTVSSIVGNLSGGEGFDLSTVIGSAVALLAGILEGDGSKPIGTAIGGYLITALDGITGGGAANNGQFIGNLITSVIGGSSAVLDEEGERTQQKDSASFFLSLISALLGASSGGR